MIPEIIQQAIDHTAPSEFWEERVDWQSQEPIDSEIQAVVALALAYIQDETELTRQQVKILYERLSEHPTAQQLALEIKDHLVRRQLARIVTYAGAESLKDIPSDVSAHKPCDPVAMGV